MLLTEKSVCVLRRGVGVLLWGALLTMSAAAQTTWTNAGTDALWSTAANWDTAAEPLATDDVILPTPLPSAGSPLTLSAGEVANQLTINGAYTLNGGDLTLTTGDITVAASTTATINTTLIGANGLTKAGTGTLILGGANNYTGATDVNAGTLTLGANNAVNSGAALNVGTGTTVANFNMDTFNQTVSALNFNVHSTSINTVTIGAGKKLTVNGSGALFKIGVAASSARRTNVTFTGGGTLEINNPATGTIVDIGLLAANDSSSDNLTVLDMRNLANFTANVDQFRIGFDYNNGATVRFSNTANTITANAFRIADTNAHNGANSTMYLGAGTNVFNATTFYFGKSKNGATVLFDAADTTGTVTLQGKTGGNATFYIASSEAAATASSLTSTIDLSGHDATIKAGTMWLGRRNDTSSGSATGILLFDQGTMTISTLNAGHRSSSGTSTVSQARGEITLGGGSTTIGTLSLANKSETSLGSATALLTVTGGTLNVNTAFTIASLATGSDPEADASGIVLITGGTVNSSANILEGGSGAVSTITLNGGTLNLNNKNIGDATNPIDTLNLQSGTLQNVAQINGGGAVSKTTAGTLILAGNNTFTGAVNVAEGKLLVNGTHTDAGLYTVSSGATLGGTGAITGNVFVQGLLAPGASIESLNVTGNMSFDASSILEIELNDLDSNIVDLLALTGDLSITSGAQLNFLVTGTPTASEYLFGTYSGNLTGLFSSTSIPAGYDLVQAGGELKLVSAVPEPGTWALLGAGLLVLVGYRRKHKQIYVLLNSL